MKCPFRTTKIVTTEGNTVTNTLAFMPCLKKECPYYSLETHHLFGCGEHPSMNFSEEKCWKCEYERSQCK